MKFLAMDSGVNVDEEKIKAHLAEDTARVWELYSDRFIREIHQRGDNPFTVLMLEAYSLEEAKSKLATIPFAKMGITEFKTVIPLQPFTGFEALFADRFLRAIA